MKSILILVLAFLHISTIAQETQKISLDDFAILLGDGWKGKLMYLNYSDGQEAFVNTEMEVVLENGKLVRQTIYPDEPKANSREVWKISKDGSKLNGEKVVSKKILEDGRTEIVTEFSGKDNRRKASMTRRYVFSKDHIEISKEVTIIKSGEKFVRNKYTYRR